MDQNQFYRLIKEGEEKLREADIESASAEVEIILLALLDIERIDLYLYGAKLADEKIIRDFHNIIERRATRYPLQYILGESWFYGRKFKVTEDVMVPTPETELLCEIAVNYVRYKKIKEPSILDMGAGSGVVSVTMACELPHAVITALDISPAVLEVARQNAEAYYAEERITFICSDMFEALKTSDRYDMILSNPPYISDDEYKDLPPEVLADPKISLVSGKEGMDIIKKLIDMAPGYLKESGQLMFEIGYNQAEIVAELTDKDDCYKKISIVKDLNDIDRVVLLALK
jgi:release factor glutamine methyltransferase